MCAFQLSAAQQQAVENRGGTLLVSAAAGSGKTRVLVERLFLVQLVYFRLNFFFRRNDFQVFP